MKEIISKFTSNSYLSVGLVVTLLSAALTFGIMFNKVSVLEAQITEVKTTQKEMNQEWKEELKAIRADQLLIKDSISELRVLLVAGQGLLPQK